MTTIRERDAEYVEGRGAGYDRHEHPESECPADVDRRALLAAGDALAEMVGGDHGLCTCEPRGTRHSHDCDVDVDLRAALTAWKAATG